MKDLRILFTPADPGYLAHLADAEGNRLGVEVPFTPFLEESDYDDLRWYLEEYMELPDGGAVVRARRIEGNLDEWGRKLHDALFTAPENRALLKELLAGPEPRELTLATRDPDLLRLPWELMADEGGSLAQRVSVRRQLETPEKTTPRPAELPLRMLYIVSRPADAGFIDPRLTAKALLDALDPLGGSVRVDFCRPPTLARMDEMLRDAQRAGEPYGLVHFDGHGTFLPQAQIGSLFFEKPDDGSGTSKADPVAADRLGDLLASYTIPLVVLEACRSATVGRTAVFRSVAPRLIQAGVGSVLSMSHAVHVEAARLLLDRFYRELVRGTTIGHAVAEARKALIATPARWIESGPGGRTVELHDWFLPHLYQREGGDALIPPEAARQQPVRQFDVFLSHQHNDSARVEALARRLMEKHGLRVWLDKWEGVPGDLKRQCGTGIANSRFTVVAGSQAALQSNWVQWEFDQHHTFNPEGDRLIPIKLEPLALPPELDALLWVDFTDPAQDATAAAYLARLIRTADAEDARRRRGFRNPATHEESGSFPPPPQYGFQGRARELYDLERQLRTQRGVVLHAMGGMGKTALATEAARWWTRSGLFRDGACFLSFEQFASAERAVQVLGTYVEGLRFEQLHATEQRRRAIEFFQQKEVLMVWDNFESTLPQFNDGASVLGSPYTVDERHRLAELFRDLTVGPGKGCLLVTCRPGETGLPRARRYELHGLARADSLWLLSSILRRDGLSLSDPRLSREKLDPLLRDLADHPLSLELVGPYLRALTPEEIRADFGKLLAEFEQEAPEGRNQSLLASLEFSRRHLSPAAREALPWLGIFSGGVFEDLLLDVSKLAPETWEPIRRELEDLVLLRTEGDIQIGGRPFLRFHPILASSTSDPALAQDPEIRQRFIGVYVALRQVLDKALTGSQSLTALKVLNQEEANYRTAVQWTLADQQFQAAAELGETFSRYLQRSGRLRDRDAWVQWLKDAVSKQGFTEDAATYERQYAWTRFTQGDPQGAVDQLQDLIERLRNTTEFDPTFELTLAVGMLGRVLGMVGAAAQAIPILREAVGNWEALVEKAAGNRSWEQLLASPDYAKAASQLGNLSATMGDLANALSSAGQHEEALAIAERCVEIQEKRGNQREVAAGQGLSASILMAAGQYDEADARYDLALVAALQTGDRELEGQVLQSQGMLADDRKQLERANHLYQRALERFQETSDLGSMMRTYNLLGVTEQKAGRVAEARAWYEKSRELAVQLQDQIGLGQAAQNIGIVFQVEGEAARKRGDESAAHRYFDEACRSVQESLHISVALGNKPAEAKSLGQLAIIHLRLGDLSAAERYAHEARQIHEALGLKEVGVDYNTLSEIAQACGDHVAATEWAKKRDDLLLELKRRVDGGGLPAQFLEVLQALSLACAQAGFGNSRLGSVEEEALAQLDQLPDPFPAIADFLRKLAVGEVSFVPYGLPTEIDSILGQVLFGLGVKPHRQTNSRSDNELVFENHEYVDEIIMSAFRQGNFERAIELCSTMTGAGKGRTEIIGLASIRQIQIGELYNGYLQFGPPNPPQSLCNENTTEDFMASWVATVLMLLLNLGGFPEEEDFILKTFNSIPSSRLGAALELASNAVHDTLWPEVWEHPSQSVSTTATSSNLGHNSHEPEALDWADNIIQGYQRLLEGCPEAAHKLFEAAQESRSLSRDRSFHLALRYLKARSLAAANRVDEALGELRALVPEAQSVGLRVFVAKITCETVIMEQSKSGAINADLLEIADRAIEEASVPLGQARLSFRKALRENLTNTDEALHMWLVAAEQYLQLMSGLARMRRGLDKFYSRTKGEIPQATIDLIQPSLYPSGSIRMKRAGAILYRQLQWVPNLVEINREAKACLVVLGEVSERRQRFSDAAIAWDVFASLAQELYRGQADECGALLLEAGHHYRLSGSLLEAENKLLAAKKFLEEKSTLHLSCRSFFELGCLKETGDNLRVALSLFKDAARCCPAEDRVMLAQLMFRQARLHLRLGNIKQGANAFRKLIVVAEGSESSEVQKLAWLAAKSLNALQVSEKG